MIIISEEDLNAYEEKLEVEKRQEERDLSNRMLQESIFLSHYKKEDSPFKCTICNLRFASKRNLIRHGKNVHEKKRFKCDLCDKIYKASVNLTYHKRKVHNIFIKEEQKHIENDHFPQ